MRSLNPAFEWLTGWTATDWLGKSILDIVHPHDHIIMLECFSVALKKDKPSECEVRLTTRGGESPIVALSLLSEQEEGRVIGVFGVGRDVTKSKLAEGELTACDAQLRESQKMEAIGRLAGGIAHDFNNLLTIITGYSQLLLGRIHPDDRLHGDVKEIRKASVRAALLTHQLLAFSRRQVMVPKIVNLNTIVETIETMLQRLIGEHIYLVTALDPSLGHVKADPGQMEQVIMNLAVNARDAMPKGGKLIIETANVKIPSTNACAAGTLSPGHYAVLRVRDTGCGMDRDTQTRMFEPFFTTKGQGQGTGLGLATVYGIVKQSDGHIMVESHPGKGTELTIYLPIVEGSVEVGEVDTPPMTFPSGTETVILVEDEPAVRTLIRNTLRLFGYTVLEARHGFEAQLISSQYPNRIHLLVTDVVMPQMSGKELADDLMQTHPNVKVLFMSGYSENAMVEQGILNSGHTFIQKPFTPEVLARKIRETLDAVYKRP